jgi:hypothetical protein
MATHPPPLARMLLAVVSLVCSSISWADVAGRRTVDVPLLLDLPGDLVQVRYTPGALDRAASVQKRFEVLASEFARTGFAATAMVLYVLSPEDWAAAGLARPYGEPQALGTDALVVPAWADGPMVARVRAWLGGDIPLPVGAPLVATREEAGALAVSDVLASIEGARLLAKRARLEGDRPWIAPVAGHLVARLAWDRFEPGRMPGIAALVDAIAATGARDPGAARPAAGDRHALAAWSEDLALADRAFFEARFLRAADFIVTGKKARGARKILSKAVRGTEPLTEAALFEEIPALAGWAADSFAAEGAAPTPVPASP